eukprot:scaffold1924_cov140-Skeletonema_menzelii.AAC.36
MLFAAPMIGLDGVPHLVQMHCARRAVCRCRPEQGWNECFSWWCWQLARAPAACPKHERDRARQDQSPPSQNPAQVEERRGTGQGKKTN